MVTHEPDVARARRRIVRMRDGIVIARRAGLGRTPRPCTRRDPAIGAIE